MYQNRQGLGQKVCLGSRFANSLLHVMDAILEASLLIEHFIEAHYIFIKLAKLLLSVSVLHENVINSILHRVPRKFF